MFENLGYSVVSLNKKEVHRYINDSYAAQSLCQIQGYFT